MDGDFVQLQPNKNHLNHLETIHATVIFGVAQPADIG